MTIPELLQWQWSGYSKYHGSRTNLLIHIVAIPLFLAGNTALVYFLIRGLWVQALASLVVMIVSMAFQGRGHRIEQSPSEPFASAANAVARIFLEQWITFPRFVVSGGWIRALSDNEVRDSRSSSPLPAQSCEERGSLSKKSAVHLSGVHGGVRTVGLRVQNQEAHTAQKFTT